MLATQEAAAMPDQHPIASAQAALAALAIEPTALQERLACLAALRSPTRAQIPILPTEAA